MRCDAVLWKLSRADRAFVFVGCQQVCSHSRCKILQVLIFKRLAWSENLKIELFTCFYMLHAAGRRARQKR